MLTILFNIIENSVIVKEEPIEDIQRPPSSIDEDNETMNNEPEMLIKTEIKDTINITTPPPPLLRQQSTTPTIVIAHPQIPVTAAVIQQNARISSPDLQSMTTNGPKYCKTCDIKFNYLNTFIAHKKFYCKSGIVDHHDTTGSSPTQPNNNSVVARATEASVL